MDQSLLMSFLVLGLIWTSLGQQTAGKKETGERALPEIRIDRDNIVVNQSVRIKPGRYVVADRDGNGVLQIAADDIVVDFGKATLESRKNASDGAKDEYDGTGIAISGRKNVTVKNARVYGYRFNLRATDSRELVIEDSDFSHSRAQRISQNGQPIDIFLDIRHPDEWREYGAAIWLENCRKCTVQGCQAEGAQNGLCLISTNGSTVHDNDFSFNSGWGIAMSGSKNNVVSWNHCDFANRPCLSGGMDNAGLAVVNGSERNYIVGNSLLYGGDGFS
jgi:parallel beta-helix repeat protein